MLNVVVVFIVKMKIVKSCFKSNMKRMEGGWGEGSLAVGRTPSYREEKPWLWTRAAQ